VTDWRQIVVLYNRLLRIQPSPVVQLNRAVAIAMRDGPEAGLAHIDAVLEDGELANYDLAFQPAQICIAGSAGQLRLGPLMRELWR
jgi:predicted RNA polymerase sigma factor